MNKRDELYVITMEECGELVQACSKVIRKGKLLPQERRKLIEEAGDVLCMLELLVEHGVMTQHDLDERVQVKRSKLKKWSSLINEPTNTKV